MGRCLFRRDDVGWQQIEEPFEEATQIGWEEPNIPHAARGQASKHLPVIAILEKAGEPQFWEAVYVSVRKVGNTMIAGIGFAGGLVLVIGFQNSEALYRFIGVDPLAVPIAADYLRGASWGVLPLMGYLALRYLCEGLSWTLPAMLIALSALLLKVPLNYLFIHGGAGMPTLGGSGCGWASAVVFWLQFGVLAMVDRDRIAEERLLPLCRWAIERHARLLASEQRSRERALREADAVSCPPCACGHGQLCAAPSRAAAGSELAPQAPQAPQSAAAA